jgi:hypothetical protein
VRANRKRCCLSTEGLELRFLGDALVALARTLDPIARYAGFFRKECDYFVWSAGRIDTAMLFQFDKLSYLEPVLGHAP